MEMRSFFANSTVQVMSHSVGLVDDTLRNIVLVINLFRASLNHSCEPNTFPFIDRGEVRVRVTKPIKAGEELTTNFTSEIGGVEYRRRILEERYGFKCECKKRPAPPGR